MSFRSLGSMLLVCLLLLSGCSSKTFLVMEDGPKGYAPNQTLGVRAGVDTGSLSPTERYSWLEICDRVDVPSFFGLLTDTHYVNCEVATNHMAQAARTTTTGYIAGVVGPVIQTGLTAGAVAYTGHAIGKGIGQSGSNFSTTNNTTSNGGSSTGGSSSSVAKGGNVSDSGNSNSVALGGTSNATASPITKNYNSSTSTSHSSSEVDVQKGAFQNTVTANGGTVGNVSGGSVGPITNTNSAMGGLGGNATGGSVGNISTSATGGLGGSVGNISNSATGGAGGVGGSIGSGAVQNYQNVNSGAAKGNGVINVGGTVN